MPPLRPLAVRRAAAAPGTDGTSPGASPAGDGAAPEAGRADEQTSADATRTAAGPSPSYRGGGRTAAAATAGATDVAGTVGAAGATRRGGRRSGRPRGDGASDPAGPTGAAARRQWPPAVTDASGPAGAARSTGHHGDITAAAVSDDAEVVPGTAPAAPATAPTDLVVHRGVEVDHATPADPDAWRRGPDGDGYFTATAFVAVPLTDLPEGAEPDVLETGVLEPARTGEIPRVPMVAVERARLEPEPVMEPNWIQRRRAHRPRVRRVTRVVRRIDTWTVFKVSVLFWAVAYLILLIAGVLLWSVAISTGTVDNVESFIRDLLALDTFTFDGGKIFRASWVLGVFMAIAGTGLTVTMAVLYNLFADLVGGVRVTVLEEEVVQRPPSSSRPS